MKFSITALSILFVFGISCSTDQSINEGNFQSVVPEQVEVLNKAQNSVTFGLFTSCASACWGEFKVTEKTDGNTYKLNTMAEVTAEICTEQCVPYDWEHTVNISEPGTYTFQFVHRDSIYHELNISFP